MKIPILKRIFKTIFTSNVVGKLLDKGLLGGLVNNFFSKKTIGYPEGKINWHQFKTDIWYTVAVLILIILYAFDYITSDQLHMILDMLPDAEPVTPIVE